MPDGFKRRRRNRKDTRAKFYAAYRTARQSRRFIGTPLDMRQVYALMKTS